MTAPAPRLVLGSSSVRRLELLQQINVIPDIIKGPDIDETPHKNELPKKYVARMALEKNQALHQEFPNDFILTADTSVVIGRRIIGKAADATEQKKFMQLMSGRAHDVITAAAVHAPNGKLVQRLNITRIKMKRLTDQEIDAYVAGNEWQGKAGYKFGGSIDHFVQSIQGSPSGIIGLPLYETMQMLRGLGYGT
jgi:septum formation protein